MQFPILEQFQAHPLPPNALVRPPLRFRVHNQYSPSSPIDLRGRMKTALQAEEQASLVEQLRILAETHGRSFEPAAAQFYTSIQRFLYDIFQACQEAPDTLIIPQKIMPYYTDPRVTHQIGQSGTHPVTGQPLDLLPAPNMTYVIALTLKSSDAHGRPYDILRPDAPRAGFYKFRDYEEITDERTITLQRSWGCWLRDAQGLAILHGMESGIL